MQKGNKILGLGILIFSITMLISHITNIPDFMEGLFMGIGTGLELLGVILLFKNKRSK